jgi:hypothetical protein
MFGKKDPAGDENNIILVHVKNIAKPLKYGLNTNPDFTQGVAPGIIILSVLL